MMVRARSFSLASLLALLACTSETSDDTGASAGASTSTTSATTTAEPTSTTATATTTAATADECPGRPSGAYNACEDANGLTNNKLCGWTADGGPQSVTCLGPQSGGFNVCALDDCVDDCDCFAPPTTGTAVAGCRAVYGDGGKACVLYCLNGQVCPDGMQCLPDYGYCYWPS
jgi:hypothetical protein